MYTQPFLTAGRPHQPGSAASSVTQASTPCGLTPHCITTSTSGAWDLTCTPDVPWRAASLHLICSRGDPVSLFRASFNC